MVVVKNHQGIVSLVAGTEYVVLALHDENGKFIDVEAFRWPVKRLKPDHVKDELKDVHSILFDYLNGLCNPHFETADKPPPDSA